MKTLARLADRLTHAAATVLLLTLLVTVVLGVISRQLNQPLAWTDELAQYLLVWTAFVGWIIAARRRTHIAITMFADMTGGRVRRGLEIAIQLCVIGFALVLLRYSFALIERTWDVESISLPIPTASLYVVMPLAAAALILQAIAQIGEAIAARDPHSTEPGAQPL